MVKKRVSALEYEVVTAKKVAGLRVMIVGEPDTGKTTIAASASLHPDLSPVCFLDIDRRLTTLAGYDNILRVSLPTAAHAAQLVRDISKPRDKWPEALREVNTFVVDSVSLFRDHMLQERAEDATEASSKDRSEYLYEQRDYGFVSNMVANLIDKLIQTGCHLILLSHQKTVYQLDNKDFPTDTVLRIEPLLNKRLQTLIHSMMHHVWYTKRKDAGTFRLLTLPRRPYIVKVTNPNFVGKLKEYTRNEVEEAKRKAAEGWVTVPYMPDSLPPTLPMLWDMYKDSIEHKLSE